MSLSQRDVCSRRSHNARGAGPRYQHRRRRPQERERDPRSRGAQRLHRASDVALYGTDSPSKRDRLRARERSPRRLRQRRFQVREHVQHGDAPSDAARPGERQRALRAEAPRGHRHEARRKTQVEGTASLLQRSGAPTRLPFESCVSRGLDEANAGEPGFRRQADQRGTRGGLLGAREGELLRDRNQLRWWPHERVLSLPLGAGLLLRGGQRRR